MNRDLHPTDGARYLLERDAPIDGGRGARYRVAIYTPDAEFTASAVLHDDGSVELGPTGAPDELHARLGAIARLVARDAAKLHADGLPAWPQRILRWRR
ncbi:MAG TPA: hypothetical protein VFT22_31910 [Kofleriaceae bacterium]|nr:hypothetical protein [Kofleriaceae bacterium]